jgi:hypothetical protein
MTLFRGENIDNWLIIKRNGFIIPKETTFEIMFKHDCTIKYDGSATYGLSKQNAINAHQIDSNLFKTSGISTTPNFEIAKKYSLHNNKYSKGVILEFDTKKLDLDIYELINVGKYIKYPKEPADNEYILKRFDNSNIPLALFNVHEVIS